MINENLIIKLNGGLGNQMFQWALARMLEETTDIHCRLDMSYFNHRYARPYQLNIFKLSPFFVDDFSTKMKLNLLWKLRDFLPDNKLFGYKLFEEKQFNFDTGIHRIQPNTFISGFFQTEKYFKNIENILREDFKFKNLPDEKNRKIIGFINEGTSISLHIRRGDYVQKKRYQNVYAQCTLNYYKKAVEYITQNCNSETPPTLFIFSDDIDWVKANLKLPYKSIYVSNNTGEKSYEDMRLMSLCTHNVIANSSFSWWGAWLNNNKNKIVVAPKKWFNDLTINQNDVIPNNWVQIDN